MSGSCAAGLASRGSCVGECRDCARLHSLPDGEARSHARDMMREFEEIQRLDYRVSAADADPLLSFARLFRGEKGNMFGVLECRDEAGTTVVLRAFSSMPWGTRDIEGWVPPLLSQETFDEIAAPGRREIEEMTEALGQLDPNGEAHRSLTDRRKQQSRALQQRLQDRYELRNFRGETRRLREAFHLNQGIPGGVGECCAPKLLHYAAMHSLTPVGLAEFYWGGPKGAQGRKQGEFYPPCSSRCEPILGFLLCGLHDEG